MKKVYDLHSLSDMLSLAKYVQSRVYWGGFFYRKDDEKSYRWKEFWDHLEEAVSLGQNRQVIIYEGDQFVEFK